MKTVEIVILGPAKSGKTCIASIISRALSDYGADVHVQDRDPLKEHKDIHITNAPVHITVENAKKPEPVSDGEPDFEQIWDGLRTADTAVATRGKYFGKD